MINIKSAKKKSTIKRKKGKPLRKVLWGKKYYLSRYDKIKLSLKDKTKEELIRVIQEQVCDKNGKPPWKIANELWRILREYDVDPNIFGEYSEIKAVSTKAFYAERLAQKVLQNIERLPNDVLIEIIAETEVMKFPTPPGFIGWERFWKDYWHSRRKGRAYPSGWK